MTLAAGLMPENLQIVTLGTDCNAWQVLSPALLGDCHGSQVSVTEPFRDPAR